MRADWGHFLRGIVDLGHDEDRAGLEHRVELPADEVRDRCGDDRRGQDDDGVTPVPVE
jgi:hypothetical protein